LRWLIGHFRTLTGVPRFIVGALVLYGRCIGTSTPDKPVLFLEIKTHDCGSLEKVIHAILAYRGKKIEGGGTEWFKTSRDEIVAIYESMAISA
jgi:hypothetical protein